MSSEIWYKWASDCLLLDVNSCLKNRIERLLRMPIGTLYRSTNFSPVPLEICEATSHYDGPERCISDSIREPTKLLTNGGHPTQCNHNLSTKQTASSRLNASLTTQLPVPHSLQYQEVEEAYQQNPPPPDLQYDLTLENSPYASGESSLSPTAANTSDAKTSELIEDTQNDDWDTLAAHSANHSNNTHCSFSSHCYSNEENPEHSLQHFELIKSHDVSSITDHNQFKDANDFMDSNFEIDYPFLNPEQSSPPPDSFKQFVHISAEENSLNVTNVTSFTSCTTNLGTTNQQGSELLKTRPQTEPRCPVLSSFREGSIFEKAIATLTPACNIDHQSSDKTEQWRHNHTQDTSDCDDHCLVPQFTNTNDAKMKLSNTEQCHTGYNTLSDSSVFHCDDTDLISEPLSDSHNQNYQSKTSLNIVKFPKPYSSLENKSDSNHANMKILHSSQISTCSDISGYTNSETCDENHSIIKSSPHCEFFREQFHEISNNNSLSSQSLESTLKNLLSARPLSSCYDPKAKKIDDYCDDKKKEKAGKTRKRSAASSQRRFEQYQEIKRRKEKIEKGVLEKKMSAHVNPANKTRFCHSFLRTGQCRNGESCLFSHDCIPQTKFTLCKFLKKGKCNRSSLCKFSHDFQNFHCRNLIINGKCEAKGCPYRHNFEVEALTFEEKWNFVENNADFLGKLTQSNKRFTQSKQTKDTKSTASIEQLDSLLPWYMLLYQQYIHAEDV